MKSIAIIKSNFIINQILEMRLYYLIKFRNIKNFKSLLLKDIFSYCFCQLVSSKMHTTTLLLTLNTYLNNRTKKHKNIHQCSCCPFSLINVILMENYIAPIHVNLLLGAEQLYKKPFTSF